MAKRVLLLGGGGAHVRLLQALARQPLAGAQVALVTPLARQLHANLLADVVAGRRAPGDCTIALPALAAAARITFVEGSVQSLDADARRVVLADGRSVHYDLLSLDGGTLMGRDRVPGARERGLFLRPAEQFVPLLGGLWDRAARRVLDVVVIGGGTPAVELALALAQRLAGQGEERARVALVAGERGPLADAAPSTARLALAALSRRRVTIFREECRALEPGAVVLAGGARLACDAPVMAGEGEAPAWLQGSGLDLDEQGHVRIGTTLQSTSHPEVLAAPADAGAGLTINLRGLMDGGRLREMRAGTRRLAFVSTGDGRAIVSWGGWSAHGRWVGWWKARRDRALVARLSPSA